MVSHNTSASIGKSARQVSCKSDAFCGRGTLSQFQDPDFRRCLKFYASAQLSYCMDGKDLGWHAAQRRNHAWATGVGNWQQLTGRVVLTPAKVPRSGWR